MQPEYKFKHIYNPKSNRLQNYDYGSNGGYFITICTKNRENYFGKIIDEKIILNEFGKIVYDEILLLEKHFDYIRIDEFVVMPNHLHLIIFVEMFFKNISTTTTKKDIYNDNNKYFSNISPKKGTIGNIIKLLKGFSSKKINKLNKIFFAWQANYYDRIIRNEEETQKIRKYIIENPLKRENDKNNDENIF